MKRDYKLVPLAGGIGTQIVEGKRDADRIAQEIACEANAAVMVHPVGEPERYRFIDPTPEGEPR